MKRKQELSEKEEEELFKLDGLIARECEEENRSKVVDNFKDMDGGEGNLNHQGVKKLRENNSQIKPNLFLERKT